MKPVPLQPNMPTPTTCFGNPVPPAQYYECPHCNKQSPLVRQWVGLTDEEKSELDAEYGDDTLAHLDAIEDKLKEKNNG